MTKQTADARYLLDIAVDSVMASQGILMTAISVGADPADCCRWLWSTWSRRIF
ncbi:MAG: hypothetical protein ACYDDT_10845 [Sulfuricella sp.]